VGPQKAGAGLRLNWPQGTLLPTTNLAGPWPAITNAAPPLAVTPTNPEGFYQIAPR
jgi:hypothetical protein